MIRKYEYEPYVGPTDDKVRIATVCPTCPWPFVTANQTHSICPNGHHTVVAEVTFGELMILTSRWN